jgi:Icc-related predicted phosphoesterase
MKIQIVSDLHLEFGDIEIKNKGADVLVLSGDICVAEDLYDHRPDSPIVLKSKRQDSAARYRNFFARVSDEFDEVVYVAGNHEHYHGKWKKAHDVLADELAQFENVHYLERACFVYKGVTFVGGTMWTDMNKGDPLTLHAVRDMMNDFAVIRDDTRGYTPLKPATVAERFRETVGYFNAVISNLNPEDKVVVVTHHAPSYLSVNENYKNETLMNGAYASDLSEFILDRQQIKLWTHGHMHDPSDYMIGNCRIVCNPRGYEGYQECAEHFNGGVVVEI